MNVGGVIFLSLTYVVLGAAMYWGSGAWGWSRKARFFYGVSGPIAVFHFMYYTGVANPNSPSEDPIRVFKQRSEFYDKWQGLSKVQRFMYTVKTSHILAAFLGCYLVVSFVIPVQLIHTIAFILMVSVAGTWVRDVLLRV
jgi:hypothetical protein